jgi:hypothetical protein
MAEVRGVYRVLVGTLERKRLLGRSRRRWEDNIKMDLQEVGLWIVPSWLRIGAVGGFHKMQGISLLSANRLASQEGLCSV